MYILNDWPNFECNDSLLYKQGSSLLHVHGYKQGKVSNNISLTQKLKQDIKLI